MLDYLDAAIVNAESAKSLADSRYICLGIPHVDNESAPTRMGGGWLGNTYYYIVAPGVMFHELGHAIGRWLTLTPIRRLSLFWPKGDRLGYVAYAMPVNARFAVIRIFIISTGPVWLGCTVLSLVGWIMAGTDFWPSYSSTFSATSPGLVEYGRAVAFPGSTC